MNSSAFTLGTAFGLMVGTAGSGLIAQDQFDLDVGLYPGLNMSGTVGTVYSIEYADDPANSDPGRWRCLEFVQLLASPYLWVDKSALATTQRFYRSVEFAVPTNMVFIPPGTFRMGSPTNEVDLWDNEGPQTAVTLSKGFWMGKYEVTQGEYLAVMGTNSSHFNGVPWVGLPDYGVDINRPVEDVSWGNATEYCVKLTERERLAGRIAPNSVYRLPTEAEWEYACRAWTSTRFSYGDDRGFTNLTNYAWYRDNSDGQTHPVGQKLPNPWGLHDMHGNVWEWCQDWYGAYAAEIALDPQGPTTGSFRVIRGGGWYYPVEFCHSACRDGGPPSRRSNSWGFRVVLAPAQP